MNFERGENSPTPSQENKSRVWMVQNNSMPHYTGFIEYKMFNDLMLMQLRKLQRWESPMCFFGNDFESHYSRTIVTCAVISADPASCWLFCGYLVGSRQWNEPPRGNKCWLTPSLLACRDTGSALISPSITRSEFIMTCFTVSVRAVEPRFTCQFLHTDGQK